MELNPNLSKTQSKYIKLNIGGVHYFSTTITLSARSSFFSNLLGNDSKWKQGKSKDNFGAYKSFF